MSVSYKLKVIVLLCLAVVSVGSTGCGNAVDVPSKSDGTVTFDAPDSFDFGRARAGDVIQHVFEFHNTSPKSKSISKIQTFCGCTVADVANSTVAPHGQLRIPVSLNTAGKRGRLSQDILVIFADADRRVYTVSGFVYNRELPAVRLDYTENLELSTTTFFLDWPDVSEFRILRASPDSETLSVSYEVVPGERRTKFVVKLHPPVSYGTYASRILIQTTDPFESEYVVPIEGYIPFPIEPEEFSIALGKLTPGAPKSVAASISAPYGGKVQIDDVRCIKGSIENWEVRYLSEELVQVVFSVIVPHESRTEAFVTIVEIDAALPEYRRTLQIEAVGVVFEV